MWYGEFETDKTLRSFFPDYNFHGIMVEVGGGDPEYLSNSFHFRQNGWKIIIVEPNPNLCLKFKQKNMEVLEYAASNKDEENLVRFEVYKPTGGLSYSSLGLRYKNDPYAGEATIIQVKQKTLNTILNLHHPQIQHIDVLSVDTEGWELEVIEGTDLDKYKPAIVLLECYGSSDRNEYTNTMKNHGYELSINIQHNFFYKRMKL
jgi:FkbM family methyltransferase